MSYANPYLICEDCGRRTTHYDSQHAVNLPCGHKAGIRSVCRSWSPVDGCQCNPECKQPKRLRLQEGVDFLRGKKIFQPTTMHYVRRPGL